MPKARATPVTPTLSMDIAAPTPKKTRTKVPSASAPSFWARVGGAVVGCAASVSVIREPLNAGVNPWRSGDAPHSRRRRVLDSGPARTRVRGWAWNRRQRSEEHTSELQSLMRNSYDVFCVKKKTTVLQCHQHNIT